jgi:hypothetical protein
MEYILSWYLQTKGAAISQMPDFKVFLGDE